MRVPFRFKMQKVLDYREQLEEEAKVNLAIQRARLAEAQDRLDKIKSELRQAEDRLVGAVLMDAAERWVLEQYVKGLRADAAHEALQVRMLEQLAEEARQPGQGDEPLGPRSPAQGRRLPAQARPRPHDPDEERRPGA